MPTISALRLRYATLRANGGWDADKTERVEFGDVLAFRSVAPLTPTPLPLGEGLWFEARANWVVRSRPGRYRRRFPAPAPQQSARPSPIPHHDSNTCCCSTFAPRRTAP